MSLWRILFKTQTQPGAHLTCDECIALLDYLADRATHGADPTNLRQAAQEYLSRCPDCHEEYQEWLRDLETPE